MLVGAVVRSRFGRADESSLKTFREVLFAVGVRLCYETFALRAWCCGFVLDGFVWCEDLGFSKWLCVELLALQYLFDSFVIVNAEYLGADGFVRLLFTFGDG